MSFSNASFITQLLIHESFCAHIVCVSPTSGAQKREWHIDM